MKTLPHPATRDMRLWISLGALTGFMGVTAGAVGAHVLGNRLQGQGQHYYDMAAHFQLWHALALIAVGLITPYAQSRKGIRLLRLAGGGFAAGSVLFCGPLYDLAIEGASHLHWLIPIGGLCLIGGWLSLAASAFFIELPPASGDR